ncbi:hypothetical protein FUA23_21380 [Neolewinella aurantiaca]|uniref:Outer membrane protein beta-barrel domain-containing protein n=1 Tax=Neolewinella aurantiaca TaxID=2602767 RepID=A0A5C7FEM9_9BACT|nr:hypothetical protein [Neolewinella aurantiaca]TXF84031.1 hypothetical protein FUA23_21380 [Neolewinella aurantiaca]
MLKQSFFLLLFCTLSLAVSAQGGTTEEQARDDLDYYNNDNDRVRDQRGDTFGSNLWFGAGAQLGFQSTSQSSFFQIGLSPIVGYKVNNFLSVGPRGSFAYNSYRQDIGGGDRFKANYATWQAGAFTRAKVIGQFFVHAEYSIVNEVEGFDADGDAVRSTRAIPFLGGGLSQGGGVGTAGFEIMLLFRLSAADRIGDSPFEIRTGLNYNF